MSIDSASQWSAGRDIPIDNERVPLPHEDFDPYFGEFAQYDSMLEASLSGVHDLGIPSVYGSSPSNYYQHSNLLDTGMGSGIPYVATVQQQQQQQQQQTLKPAQLAKFSKMMNLNNVAATHQTLENRKVFLHVPVTPQSSPMKNISSTPASSFDNSGAQFSTTASHSSDIYLDIPPTPGYTPSHSPARNAGVRHRAMRSNGDSQMMINLGARDESESEAFFSSPSYSPNLDASPEISNYPQFCTGVTPHLQSMNVFSASDMAPVRPDPSQAAGGATSDSDIAWQPVLTLPSNDETQTIINTQLLQGTIRQSNRKSCLPPGKVDEYLAGPNHDGQFECLYPNCGKLFRRRYNVRSHIQTHLCDRPYACDICGSCFVRPHDLRRHEKVHAEERPHVCPCGKGFTRHDALQRHRIRLICKGGIEIPGKPRRVPAKRGRPKKNPQPSSPHAYGYESESQDQSPYSSSEQECF